MSSTQRRLVKRKNSAPFSIICLSCQFQQPPMNVTQSTQTDCDDKSENDDEIVVLHDYEIGYFHHENDILVEMEHLYFLFFEKIHDVEIEECTMMMNGRLYFSQEKLHSFCQDLGFPYDDDDIEHQQSWLSLYSLLLHRQSFYEIFDICRTTVFSSSMSIFRQFSRRRKICYHFRRLYE